MSITKHYPIGQVCKITDLPHSTIRFWEKTFPGLKPTRSSGGHRYYSADQVELIKLLKKLLHEEGRTIEGAKKHLMAKKNGNTDDSGDPAQLDGKTKAYIKAELQDILEFLKKLE